MAPRNPEANKIVNIDKSRIMIANPREDHTETNIRTSDLLGIPRKNCICRLEHKLHMKETIQNAL